MREPYRLSFTLHEVPLTLNEMMGKHWRSRHNSFSLIHKLIYLQTLKYKPETPIERARVAITRYSSGTLDRDNAYFTAKPVLDGLVECGIIKDDGFNQVKFLEVNQVKIKRNEKRKLEVSLEEINE